MLDLIFQIIFFSVILITVFQAVVIELVAPDTVSNGSFGQNDQVKQAKEILLPLYKENTDQIINLYISNGTYKVSPDELEGVVDPRADHISEAESFLMRSLKK